MVYVECVVTGIEMKIIREEECISFGRNTPYTHGVTLLPGLCSGNANTVGACKIVCELPSNSLNQCKCLVLLCLHEGRNNVYFGYCSISRI